METWSQPLADKLFDPRDFEEAERAALAEGLNAGQAEAVGKALSAEQVACIRGPIRSCARIPYFLPP
jgi:hypothetical protein